MKSLNEITTSYAVKQNSDVEIEKMIVESNEVLDEPQCDVTSVLSDICDALGLSDDLYTTLSKVETIDEDSAKLISDSISKLNEAYQMIDRKYGIVESKTKNSSAIIDAENIFLEDIVS